MQTTLLGYERVTPASGKTPFTMLHVAYPKQGAIGKVTESIYIAEGFVLPTLAEGMTLDVDRNGKGFVVDVKEVAATPAESPFAKAPAKK
jgi:hypothetical protein